MPAPMMMASNPERSFSRFPLAYPKILSCREAIRFRAPEQTLGMHTGQACRLAEGGGGGGRGGVCRPPARSGSALLAPVSDPIVLTIRDR